MLQCALTLTADMDPDARRIEEIYKDYLACLNLQDWHELGRFVTEGVCHNGRAFGLAGYRRMLEGDFRAIPDLRFQAMLIAATPPVLACRLAFDCTPVGDLFGMPVNGRRIRFDEHAFYRFENGRIEEVWSIIDQAAIARQLSASGKN